MRSRVPCAARPVAQRRDEPLVEQLGQRPAPVVRESRAVRRRDRRKQRQQRRDIVAAAPLKLRARSGDQSAAVNLEAVAEDRKRQASGKRRSAAARRPASRYRVSAPRS